MITIPEYQQMLALEQEIVHAQTAEMTKEEFLMQPAPGGNCMLWVLAHLADNLREIQQALGADPLQGTEILDRFKRGSEPVRGPEPGLPSGAEVLAVYDRLHQALTTRLSAMTPTDFDEQIPMHGSQARRGWVAFFYIFHHSYHVGQLEYLRNLAGHNEKII